jgi:hypothetical protein
VRLPSALDFRALLRDVPHDPWARFARSVTVVHCAVAQRRIAPHASDFLMDTGSAAAQIDASDVGTMSAAQFYASDFMVH